MHIRIARIASLILYFDLFFIIIFILTWYKPGLKITGIIGMVSAVTVLVCMVIDLVISTINQNKEDFQNGRSKKARIKK